jgi:hypothetical protein
MMTRRQLIGARLQAWRPGAIGACSPERWRSMPGRMIDSGASLGHRLRTGLDIPPVSIERSARVVVAGAGIAGLAACCALGANQVKDVLLIDALAQPGGNSSFGSNAVSAYPWGAHYVPLVRPDCQPVLKLFRRAEDHSRSGFPRAANLR